MTGGYFAVQVRLAGRFFQYSDREQKYIQYLKESKIHMSRDRDKRGRHVTFVMRKEATPR